MKIRTIFQDIFNILGLKILDSEVYPEVLRSDLIRQPCSYSAGPPALWSGHDSRSGVAAGQPRLEPVPAGHLVQGFGAALVGDGTGASGIVWDSK